MKVLHLTLERKWFDLIAKGEKKIEYRDIKSHWIDRLIEFDHDIEHGEYEEYIQLLIIDSRDNGPIRELNEFYGASWIHYDEVWFYNGGYFDKNKFPFMRLRWHGIGVLNGKFNIHLGEILEIKNWK